ncbi:MAG: HNH endonuclease [Patescibacteria group bacterium]
MPKKRSWTEKELKDAVKNSKSLRQVLKKLNLREAGGNYDQVKKYIKEYDLDSGHFTGKAWNRGMRGIGRPRLSLDAILVKGSAFQSFKLKSRLFKAGLKPQYCEQCNWAERTYDGYLPLELDHINGNRHDNRLNNLRVLCPNCHSLTDNHRGRGGRKKPRW